MRVRLKGINSRRKTLATGEVVTYWYAWKGGPRLEGKPGSPEFHSSYNAAVATRRAPPQGVLLSIIQGYQFAGFPMKSGAPVSEATRLDYIKKIKIIEKEFADFPLGALADRRTRSEFMAWRDKLALRSRRQADYAWTVLARILSWALDRGLIQANPCEKGGRLYRGNRASKVWTHDDEAAFLKSAPKHLHLPLQMALWTGQRQGDLLRLTWSAYDGTHIRLRQSKGGRRVTIKVGAPLKVALDIAQKAKISPTILLNTDGLPWTADGFRSSWRKAQAKAGIEGVTFHDMRGTAVTRLAIAGATEAEIATITGHSLKDVRSVLDANYLSRDAELGDNAIRKLEKRTNSSDRAPD